MVAAWKLFTDWFVANLFWGLSEDFSEFEAPQGEATYKTFGANGGPAEAADAQFMGEV